MAVLNFLLTLFAHFTREEERLDLVSLREGTECSAFKPFFPSVWLQERAHGLLSMMWKLPGSTLGEGFQVSALSVTGQVSLSDLGQ